MCRVVCLLAAVVLIFPSVLSPQGNRQVTAADVKALSLAIEDEIYDYDYQARFVDVGRQTEQGEHNMPVYVQPSFNDQGLAWAIYKLMPYGEVLRMFSMRKDGTAMLGNNPEFGFPPTEPSYLTVYMDDDELCHDKRTWLKANFVIQLHPSAQRLREAAERQKERIGYSVRLDPSHRLVPPGRDPRCPVN
jgi:hypothetical protein